VIKVFEPSHDLKMSIPILAFDLENMMFPKGIVLHLWLADFDFRRFVFPHWHQIFERWCYALLHLDYILLFLEGCRLGILSKFSGIEIIVGSVLKTIVCNLLAEFLGIHIILSCVLALILVCIIKSSTTVIVPKDMRWG
jgi:hypothetical protein